MLCCFIHSSSFHTDPQFNIDYIIGDIKVESFDENGKSFYMSEHGVTIIVPKMAIPSGIIAEMKFAATLIAPVNFSRNTIPVSALVWLCMNVTLQKPIQLQIPHYVNIKTENQSKSLQFAKGNIHSLDSMEVGMMQAIDGGIFPVGESYGKIEIDHFCYYCIQQIEVDDIPENLYRVVTMKEIQPNMAINLWNIHVCVIPSLDTCFQVQFTIYLQNTCYVAIAMYVCYFNINN